jgi:hypothetical protein
MELETEGDFDLMELFGISDEVRSGYQEIQVTSQVNTDTENLESQKEKINLSPAYDVVNNGAKVNAQIQKK